ncbi:hypothetical protein VP01_1855g1 [Puccinia sorghi]|uniref:Uncharacterized protein n=1 Tax=Puccinia sorghi TaxID=27349 RepID=A0A0L6VDJ6_9BASI|nr:hypothetical protein VP01_1855g1 [Puccinia sorghi]
MSDEHQLTQSAGLKCRFRDLKGLDTTGRAKRGFNKKEGPHFAFSGNFWQWSSQCKRNIFTLGEFLISFLLASGFRLRKHVLDETAFQLPTRLSGLPHHYLEHAANPSGTQSALFIGKTITHYVPFVRIIHVSLPQECTNNSQQHPYLYLVISHLENPLNTSMSLAGLSLIESTSLTILKKQTIGIDQSIHGKSSHTRNQEATGKPDTLQCRTRRLEVVQTNTGLGTTNKFSNSITHQQGAARCSEWFHRGASSSCPTRTYTHDFGFVDIIPRRFNRKKPITIILVTICCCFCASLLHKTMLRNIIMNQTHVNKYNFGVKSIIGDENLVVNGKDATKYSKPQLFFKGHVEPRKRLVAE